jgi:hypothetical protein
MKKTLDTSPITNELKGASLYFARARDEKQQADNARDNKPAPVQVKQDVLVPVPPNGVPRTPVPPRRIIKQRQPFDIFEDQYKKLKQIADNERIQGLPGSMSRMVREAIDQYLQEKHKA